MAERTGVAPDEWIIKEGLVSEEAFYRALADDLDLPFLANPRLGMLTAFPRCIETAVAPLDAENAYVVAPQGLQLSRLLELGASRPDGLSVTSPSILREAVLEHCAMSVAEGAAEELQRRRPDYAFPRREFARTIAVAGGLAGACAAAAYLAPASVLLTFSFVLGLAFLCMVVLRLLAVTHPAAVSSLSPPRTHDSVLPIYTVIVALHREGRVVPQLIEALRSLDYPAAKLDIKLVIEKHDRETAQALAAAALPAWMHVIVAPPGQPRTKPRALNVALALARGAFTVVYDAEDQPDPQQLRAAVSLFRALPDEVACLQARLAPGTGTTGSPASLPSSMRPCSTSSIRA
jgi:hypothetical protein